jgi:hypothetical protein
LGLAVFLVAEVSVSMAPVASEEQKNATSPPSASPRAEAGGQRANARQQRLREGSQLVDQLGEFRDSGDRVVFQSLDKTLSLQVLENLALERVSRVLDELRSTRIFSVTGTVTEFRGVNYLLVTHAVLKAKPPTQRAGQAVEKKPLGTD